MFQLNLSRGRQSSANNQVLNSWRVSASRSNQMESARFTGRLLKRDQSQSMYLTRFANTQDMALEDKAGAPPPSARHSTGKRAAGGTRTPGSSPSKRRYQKERGRHDGSKGRSPDDQQRHGPNIVVRGGESFVKQTQHHLKVEIGNKEAVHSMTTQVHPAVRPAPSQMDRKQVVSLTNESHVAVVDMVGLLQ